MLDNDGSVALEVDSTLDDGSVDLEVDGALDGGVRVGTLLLEELAPEEIEYSVVIGNYIFQE